MMLVFAVDLSQLIIIEFAAANAPLIGIAFEADFVVAKW